MKRLRRSVRGSKKKKEVPKCSIMSSKCPMNVQGRSEENLLEEDDGLGLTPEECEFLQYSWEKAISTVDVGGELIVRLLNDKRSLFRQLLESHYQTIDKKEFTVAIVNKECPRAKQVGEGVVRFINMLFEKLSEGATPAEIRQLCNELGARHYRMRVWFQAENWLCVKNSLLEVILVLGNKSSSGGLISMCVGGQPQPKFFGDSNAQRAAWTKMIQCIIRNMKRGFLAEALKNDSSPEMSPEKK